MSDGLIPVADALARIFDLVAPLGTEDVPLRDAGGRILSRQVAALHDQPPFDAASMDGYAIADGPAERHRVIGTSRAGRRHRGRVGPGEAVRIFTGAPVPEGATRVVIQEDVTRDGDAITLADGADPGPYIRPAGHDFRQGDPGPAPGRLRPVDIALLAAMGHGSIPVARPPRVAIIATGDELASPGDPLGPDQIHASNHLGLAAMVNRAGGIATVLPIAGDDPVLLDAAFGLAAGSDLILTIGGASVGDHDLVAAAAERRGLEASFYKVAMRPGKPLMAGRLDGAAMIGLPGNPVSSLVCGHVFVVPAIRAMLGMAARPAPRASAPLAAPVGGNGPREHYMRAAWDGPALRVAERQDSALLSVLAAADALVVRAPNAPPLEAGEAVDYLSI